MSSFTKCKLTYICKPKNHLAAEHFNRAAELSRIYRVIYCLVYMRQYIEHCGCVIPVLAFTDVQLRRTNYTICVGQTAEDGRFPTSPTEPRDGFRTLLCLLRINEADMKPCSCPLPCDEHAYDVAVSTSGPWPHKSYRRAFYEGFVSGNKYGERLSRLAHDKVSTVT